MLRLNSKNKIKNTPVHIFLHLLLCPFPQPDCASVSVSQMPFHSTFKYKAHLHESPDA